MRTCDFDVGARKFRILVEFTDECVASGVRDLRVQNREPVTILLLNYLIIRVFLRDLLKARFYGAERKRRRKVSVDRVEQSKLMPTTHRNGLAASAHANTCESDRPRLRGREAVKPLCVHSIWI